jgi:hypothetical protein
VKGPDPPYFREGFTDFTLAEKFILDRDRVRALINNADVQPGLPLAPSGAA